MYRVRRSLNDLKTRWLRLAAFVAALAQLAVAFAPVIEARNARSPGAHVEASTGTRCQYVHNEADCAACVTAHHPGRIERPCNPVSAATGQHWSVSGGPSRPASSRYFSHHASRAPPVAV